MAYTVGPDTVTTTKCSPRSEIVSDATVHQTFPTTVTFTLDTTRQWPRYHVIWSGAKLELCGVRTLVAVLVMAVHHLLTQTHELTEKTLVGSR